MLRAVLDTNILVSALWSAEGTPAKIIEMIFADILLPCHDFRILREYRIVLGRPKFGFHHAGVEDLLAEISGRGLSVTVAASNIALPDESDRKFYDVAKSCEAFLVTGNLKHFPKEPHILSPAEFAKQVLRYS
jgi:putative PIN family toxin of toxin-antitoxin system